MKYLAALVLSPCAIGCGPDLSAFDFPIETASLSAVITNVSAIAGGSFGGGTVLFTSVDGVTQEAAIDLNGPRLDLGVGLWVDLGGLEIDVSQVSAPRAADVFGSYFGTGGHFHALLGVSGRELSNASGARLVTPGGDVGLGVSAGFDLEWLGLDPASEE